MSTGRVARADGGAAPIGGPPSWRLAASAHRISSGGLRGGAPPRVMSLSAAGSKFVDALLDGSVHRPRNGAEATLVDRLLRAGLIVETHRPPVDLDVTFVIPARATVAEVQAVLAGCRPDPTTAAAEATIGHGSAAQGPDAAAGQPDTASRHQGAAARKPGTVAASSHGAHAVVVVDDGSDPPLAGLRHDGPLTVLRHQSSLGPSAARNAGARLAESEWIAFIDADCLATPGWAQSLAAYATDTTAALAPRIVSAADPRPQTAFDRAVCALDLGAEPAFVGPGRRTTYVPSTALLVRREAFLGAGGFDESLRTGEDVDLVWRLAREHDVRYVPHVTVRHRPRPLLAALARRVAYGSSAAELAGRHPGVMRHVDLPLGPALPALGWLLGGWRAALAGTVGGLTLAATSSVPLQPADRARVAVEGLGLGTTVVATGMLRPLVPLAALAALTNRRLAGRIAVLAAISALYRRREPRAAGWQLVDDVAYSIGVWSGALRTGRVAPLLPRIRRPRFRRTTSTPAPSASAPEPDEACGSGAQGSSVTGPSTTGPSTAGSGPAGPDADGPKGARERPDRTHLAARGAEHSAGPAAGGEGRSATDR